MATKKDLVEAYSFSRRRLVTAFVSGAPGGREVEPTRPGRAVIGGIAIAILLLAGAAVYKYLGSPVTFEEDKAQLVSEKESGADYVYIESAEGGFQLRPVINITSAMLLLGADAEPVVLPREKINGLEPGPPIGILQAPATPPPVDKLIDTGWTACTGAVDGQPVGIKVTVSPSPRVVETPDVSFVVRAVTPGPAADDGSGPLYLIAESSRGSADEVPRAYAYRVPQDQDSANAVLSAVAASGSSQAVDVPAQWVTTFPQGGALDLVTFGLDQRDVGRPFPGRPDAGPLRTAKVGDILEVDPRSYLLMPDGSATLLDEFSRAVYLGIAPRGQTTRDGGDSLPSGILPTDSSTIDDSGWPLAATTEQPSGELCSLLRAAPGAAPYAVLGRAEPGSEASAEGVDADGAPLAAVEPGAGAFVRSGGWFDEEAPTRVLVDDRGVRYGVAGAEEAASLGYDSEPAEVVPDSWLELFAPGVLLSIEAARCPPTSQARAGSCG